MKFLRFAALVVVPLAFAQGAAAQSTAPAGDPVVATVNGTKILRSDVDAARLQLPEHYRNLPMDQIFEPLLSQLIRTKLLAGQARAEKLDETAVYKKRIALLQDRLLEQAFLGTAIDKQVTDDALRARYKESIAKFPTKEEVRARHILVKTEGEAKAIIVELQGGADFAKVAAEKSIGPSKTRGGDLDYFGRGQMVPPFEDAAFGLKKGEITKAPVQSPFGWHVIKLEDRRQSKPPSFDESRAQLSEQMSQEIATKLVNALTEKATIQRFGPDGSAPRLRRVPPAQ